MTDPRFTSADFDQPLSDRARQHRDALLPILRDEVVRSARRRAHRRIGAAVAAAALLLAATTLMLRTAPAPHTPPTGPIAQGPGDTTSPTPPGAVVDAPPPPIEPPRRSTLAPSITLVSTDHAALDSITVRAPLQREGLILTDDQLLDLLTELGRPGGIIRTEGKAWVTSAAANPAPDVTPPPAL